MQNCKDLWGVALYSQSLSDSGRAGTKLAKAPQDRFPSAWPEN
jgi:hypothetical protein